MILFFEYIAQMNINDHFVRSVPTLASFYENSKALQS